MKSKQILVLTLVTALFITSFISADTIGSTTITISVNNNTLSFIDSGYSGNNHNFTLSNSTNTTQTFAIDQLFVEATTNVSSDVVTQLANCLTSNASTSSAL